LVDAAGEESGRDQPGEQLFAHGPVEAPELRRLVDGEAKPGGFLEFFPDALNQLH
jgi:hypothetical protein